MAGLHTLSILVNLVLVSQVYVLSDQISTPATYCGTYPSVINLGQGSSSYIIRNEGFGTREYNNNEACSVVFRTSCVPVQLNITFTSFSLEHDTYCLYDSLCIKGVRFCGNWDGSFFYYVVPAYETLIMSFATDNSTVSSGFEIRVDSWNQNNNSWYNEPADGYGSNLELIKFDWPYPHRPYGGDCPSYGPTAASTTPDYDVSTTESGTGNVCDPENTNESDNTAGSSSENLPIVQCEGTQSWYQLYPTTNNNSFILRSSNFGRRYNNNENCKIQFITSNIPQVLTFVYRHFDIEAHTSCNYDSLCIKGVKFCGVWLARRIVSYAVPANNSFTIDFRSDSTRGELGFEIAVDARDMQQNEQFTEIAGGVGGTPQGLQYSLTNIYEYQDICPNTTSKAARAINNFQTSNTDYNDETYSHDYNFERSSVYFSSEIFNVEYSLETSSPDYNFETSSVDYNFESSSIDYNFESSSVDYNHEASSPDYR